MFTRNQFRNQKVLVAGCGRFGACLAAALSEAGYDILVIDKQKRLPSGVFLTAFRGLKSKGMLRM